MEIQEEKSPTFEDLLREFTRTSVPKKEPVVEKVVVEPIKPQKEITKSYNEISRSKLHSDYERFEEFQIEEEPIEDWTSLLRESGGVRRAFIYSEIFRESIDHIFLNVTGTLILLFTALPSITLSSYG